MIANPSDRIVGGLGAQVLCNSDGSISATMVAGKGFALGAAFEDFTQIVAPANPASGTRRLFTNSATGHLSIINSVGGITDLETVSAGGTVTSVSVVTANGVSGSVANPTTTPAITVSLGAITPTSVNGLTITSSTGTLTVTNAKVLSVTNTLTLSGTDSSTLNIGAGGTLGSAAFTAASDYVPKTTTVNGKALSTNIVLGLASTDFVNQGTTTTVLHGNAAGNPSFAAVGINDVTGATGTGSFVFATTPTLVTPILGVASVTSINKLTITAPATGSTLTIADGKTLTISNSLTFTGTDSSSVAFGTGGTVSYATGASPSASLGLAAINGGAATFMRSDAAPALSQAIIPTWTGLHIFANGFQDKAGQVFNVLAYGADPTGVADSSTAFNNAIAAAAVGVGPLTGAIVLVPTGTYKWNSTVTIGNGTSTTVSTYSAVSLVGVGGTRSTTTAPIYGAVQIIWGGGAGGTMLKIAGPIGGVRVENLLLACLDVAGVGILNMHAEGTIIRNVQIVGNTTIALDVDAYNATTFTGQSVFNYGYTGLVENLFINSTNNNCTGVRLGKTGPVSQWTFTGGRWRMDGTTGSAALELRLADHNTFTGIVGAAAQGIRFKPIAGAAAYPHNNFFFGGSWVGSSGANATVIDNTDATWAPGTFGIPFFPFQTADGAAIPTDVHLWGVSDTRTWFGTFTFRDALTLTSTINKVTITAPATGSILTIADGKTLTVNNSLVLAGSDATTMTFPTTSATIARTDAGQTFIGTQAFGALTVSTINKVTITAPATGSTLTIADGKTLTVNNSLVLAGTDATTMTFPTTSATIARTDAGQTFTGTQAFGALTVSGTYIHTISNAAAFSIGPNGDTNPVLRIITNTASQADGISINGLAAGGGTTITALSSGSNSPISLVAKGTGGIVLAGTGTNDSAAAGKVGEYIEASATPGSVSLTTATAKTVTSISLTAGDWDVTCFAYFTTAGTTALQDVFTCISQTNNTIDFTAGRFVEEVDPSTVPGAGTARTQVVPRLRVSLSATTTVFLVVQANFTVSTLTVGGHISARRRR